VTVSCLALSTFLAPFLGWALVDDFKISLDVIAALLTIVGFSINDTIVIFDRLREIRGKSPFVTPVMVDRALNQTLSRTILTSGTSLLATLILYIVGGQGIHAFAFYDADRHHQRYVQHDLHCLAVGALAAAASGSEGVSQRSGPPTSISGPDQSAAQTNESTVRARESLAIDSNVPRLPAEACGRFFLMQS